MTTAINAAAASKRDNLTDELTEAELSKVIGGVTPSIPIPPPRPGFLAR
jgi:bacteriocin-like protein